MNMTDAVKALDELDRAAQTGKPDAIARAILRNVWPLYDRHYDELVRMVGSLPTETLDRHPVLRGLHPLTPIRACKSPRSMPRMSAPDTRDSDPDQEDLLTMTQMMLLRVFGDESGSVRCAQRLSARLERTRNDARERPEGPLWYYHLQIGSTYLSAGQTAQALYELATARQITVVNQDPQAERVTLGRIAVAHAVRGSLDDAASALALAKARPAPRASEANAVAATEAVATALIAVERMAPDIDDALAALPPYDCFEAMWPFAALARSRGLLAQDRPGEALEATRLTAGTHPVQAGSMACDVLDAAAIEATMNLGDIGRAQRLADAARTPSGVLTRLARARLALHVGDVEAAHRILRSPRETPTSGPAQRIETGLLSVWCEFARTGTLIPPVAGRVHRAGVNADNRRIFATLPRTLIDDVARRLPQDAVCEFARVQHGIRYRRVHRHARLTAGETRVLRALPLHDTTASMAAAFHVSPNTVKTQLKSLYRKLGCSSRDEALQMAAGTHFAVPERMSA